jgi:hypothetical protein
MAYGGTRDLVVVAGKGACIIVGLFPWTLFCVVTPWIIRYKPHNNPPVQFITQTAPTHT